MSVRGAFPIRSRHGARHVSEHSVSLHVRCDRLEHAVEWLETSRALGLVLPKVGSFVTVLVPEHHVSAAIAANKYTLVYYEFLEGERIAARLYEGPKEIAHLERSLELGTTKFDAKPWIQHRVIDRAQAKVLQKRLGAPWPERTERHWVADVLGLHSVTWSSGEELMVARDEMVARHPGSILVQASDPSLDAPRPRLGRTTPVPAVPAAPAVAPRSSPVPAVLSSPAVPEVAPRATPVPQPSALPALPVVRFKPTTAPPPIAPAAVSPPPAPPIAPPAPAPPAAPPPPPARSASPSQPPPDVRPRAPLPRPDGAPSDVSPPPDRPRIPLPRPVARPLVGIDDPLLDLDDDDDDVIDVPAPTRRPRSLSVLDEVDDGDEVDNNATAPRYPAPPPSPAPPAPRMQRQPAHTPLPSNNPYNHLPLSDPDTDEPIAANRAPSEAPRSQSVVLCTLTKQRRKVLGEDPKLIDAFLEARFEESIPGLLDLGARAHELAMILATIARDLPEALYATKARLIPRTNARIFDKADVVRIAADLRSIDPNDASTICRDPRIAEDLRELITLYTEAAQRGHAIMIAIE
jgi:hypothetical protein